MSLRIRIYVKMTVTLELRERQRRSASVARCEEGQALRLLHRPLAEALAEALAIPEAATHDAHHHKSGLPHFKSRHDPGNFIAGPQNIDQHLPIM